MTQTRSRSKARRRRKREDPAENDTAVGKDAATKETSLDNENTNNSIGNNATLDQESTSYKRMLLKMRKRRPRWLAMLDIDRSAVTAWRKTALGVVVLTTLTLILTGLIDNPLHLKHSLDHRIESRGASRHLLSTNSTSHKPAWEDCTYELNHVKEAWIVSHSLCVIIIFIALAIVCDDFFVPSLEAISEKLNLSEDVAGATFMAAGSSAPELFTSVAGVAVETDVGIGTIVGSAVFNILIIIALTVALAGQVLNLDWRPLCRDSFFYAMSIGCFIGFAWDGFFVHYEAVILLVLYCLYIILMVFNPRLMDWMATWRCICKASVNPVDEEKNADKTGPETPDAVTQDTQVGNSNPQLKNNVNANDRKYSLAGGHARRVSIISQKSENDRSIFHHHQRGSLVSALNPHTLPKKSLTPDDPIKEEETPSSNGSQAAEDEEEEEETMQLCPCLPCCPAVRTSPPTADDARKEGTCWAWTKHVLRWALWIPAFPFVCLFSWTIPDCSKDHNRKWFIVSFVMSVFWIALLSFAMVTFVSRIGCILDFDDYIMGLIIIAMGTSIPDALSSILVARDGYGDMAVSNAVGSNVFDINLGLGLPFLIRIIIDGGAPIALLSDEEWIDYHSGLMTMVPHAKFGFILLVILILALTIFGIARFRLTKLIGISFVILYICFIAYALIQELYCVEKLRSYC